MELDITSDEFAQAVANAGAAARLDALQRGQPVVYIDDEGRFIEERPDGRRFEIRFEPNQPPEHHKVIVREIFPHAA